MLLTASTNPLFGFGQRYVMLHEKTIIIINVKVNDMYPVPMGKLTVLET